MNTDDVVRVLRAAEAQLRADEVDPGYIADFVLGLAVRLGRSIEDAKRRAVGDQW